MSFSNVGIDRKHQLARANVRTVNLKLYDTIHTHDGAWNLVSRNNIGPFELSQQRASNQIAWIAGEQTRDKVRERRFFTFAKKDRRHCARDSVHGKSISSWKPTSVRAARKVGRLRGDASMDESFYVGSAQSRRPAEKRKREDPRLGVNDTIEPGLAARGVCVPRGELQMECSH